MNHLAAPDAADPTTGDDLRELTMVKGCGQDVPADSFAAASARGQLDGLCIVDGQGRVLAANDAYRDEHSASLPPAQLAEEVRRRLAGDPPSELALHPPAILHMDRLEGPSGPLMLVTLRRRDATPPAPVRDALTHLPDRRAVVDCAEAWRHAAPGNLPRFAVLFLDLDDFKGVNDRHGHAVGDAVLEQLAARWLQCVRDADMVARYGGDEFVLLIKDAATPEEVEPVIRRLRDATKQPVLVGNLSLLVDATIGWSVPADSLWTIDALVAAADRDMYARKGRVLR
jgi:diguanylate cyclase (GGDEF)-like protein